MRFSEQKSHLLNQKKKKKKEEEEDREQKSQQNLQRNEIDIETAVDLRSSQGVRICSIFSNVFIMKKISKDNCIFIVSNLHLL